MIVGQAIERRGRGHNHSTPSIGDDGLEIFGTLNACGIVKVGSGNMLVEKPVHSAADDRHEVEDLSARCAALQAALNSADMSSERRTRAINLSPLSWYEP